MVLFTKEKYPEGKSQQIIPHYKGLLSTYAEWHALSIGFYHGVSEDKEIPRGVLNENSDVEKEPHMAKTGFVMGVAAKYVAVGLAFKYGFASFL